MQRYLFPCLLLLSGLARGEVIDPKKYVLQQLSTTLPDELINMKNCSAEQMNALSPTRFPKKTDRTIDDGPSAPLAFLLGICHAHQPNQTLDTIYRSIENLQLAPTRGLMPSQKSAAALFEGIQHCRAAALYNGTRTTILRDKDLFCQHRAMARDAFTEINWLTLNLKYENPLRDASALSAQIGACGDELLNKDLDAVCSIITPMDQTSVNVLAQKAVGEVMPKFIDVTAPKDAQSNLPPFTAMLSRKLSLTTDAIRNMSQELTKIKADSAQLHGDVGNLVGLYGTYDTQNDALEIGAGTIPARIAVLKDRYLAAVSMASVLLELAKRWEDGLATGGDLSNKSTALLGQIAELNNQLKFIKENDGSKDSLFSAVAILRDGVAKAQGGDAQRQKKVVRSFCALYFCDLRTLNKSNFENICKTTIQGTTTQFYTTNALCDHSSNPAVVKGNDGATRRVSELCTSNGFDSRYVQTNLTESAADACMNSQFDPIFWDRPAAVAKGP